MERSYIINTQNLRKPATLKRVRKKIPNPFYNFQFSILNLITEGDVDEEVVVLTKLNLILET